MTNPLRAFPDHHEPRFTSRVGHLNPATLVNRSQASCPYGREGSLDQQDFHFSSCILSLLGGGSRHRRARYAEEVLAARILPAVGAVVRGRGTARICGTEYVPRSRYSASAERVPLERIWSADRLRHIAEGLGCDLDACTHAWGRGEYPNRPRLPEVGRRLAMRLAGVGSLVLGEARRSDSRCADRRNTLEARGSAVLIAERYFVVGVVGGVRLNHNSTAPPNGTTAALPTA